MQHMITLAAHAVELSTLGWTISIIAIASIFIGAFTFSVMCEKNCTKKTITKKASRT